MSNFDLLQTAPDRVSGAYTPFLGDCTLYVGYWVFSMGVFLLSAAGTGSDPQMPHGFICLFMRDAYMVNVRNLRLVV